MITTLKYLFDYFIIYFLFLLLKGKFPLDRDKISLST